MFIFSLEILGHHPADGAAGGGPHPEARLQALAGQGQVHARGQVLKRQVQGQVGVQQAEPGRDGGEPGGEAQQEREVELLPRGRRLLLLGQHQRPRPEGRQGQLQVVLEGKCT